MALPSRSSLYGPQLAGWVTAMPSGGPPSRWLTWSTAHRSRRATRVSAAKGEPPTSTGTGSPTRRLNSLATRSGSETARRRAVSPVRSSPSARSSSTDGIAAPRVASCTTSVRPSRRMAAAVKVVPTSTPSQYRPAISGTLVAPRVVPVRPALGPEHVGRRRSDDGPIGEVRLHRHVHPDQHVRFDADALADRGVHADPGVRADRGAPAEDDA